MASNKSVGAGRDGAVPVRASQYCARVALDASAGGRSTSSLASRVARGSHLHLGSLGALRLDHRHVDRDRSRRHRNKPRNARVLLCACRDLAWASSVARRCCSKGGTGAERRLGCVGGCGNRGLAVCRPAGVDSTNGSRFGRILQSAPRHTVYAGPKADQSR